MSMNKNIPTRLHRRRIDELHALFNSLVYYREKYQTSPRQTPAQLIMAIKTLGLDRVETEQSLNERYQRKALENAQAQFDCLLSLLRERTLYGARLKKIHEDNKKFYNPLAMDHIQNLVTQTMTMNEARLTELYTETDKTANLLIHSGNATAAEILEKTEAATRIGTAPQEYTPVSMIHAYLDLAEEILKAGHISLAHAILTRTASDPIRTTLKTINASGDLIDQATHMATKYESRFNLH